MSTSFARHRPKGELSPLELLMLSFSIAVILLVAAPL